KRSKKDDLVPGDLREFADELFAMVFIQVLVNIDHKDRGDHLCREIFNDVVSRAVDIDLIPVPQADLIIICLLYDIEVLLVGVYVYPDKGIREGLRPDAAADIQDTICIQQFAL